MDGKTVAKQDVSESLVDALAAWKELQESEEIQWMLFHVPDNWFVKQFEVIRSTSSTAGIVGLSDKLKEMAKDGIPAWGVFMVRTTYSPTPIDSIPPNRKNLTDPTAENEEVPRITPRKDLVVTVEAHGNTASLEFPSGGKDIGGSSASSKSKKLHRQQSLVLTTLEEQNELIKSKEGSIVSRKFVGFQLFPPNTKFLQRRHVNLVKEQIKSEFKGCDMFLDTENRHEIVDIRAISTTLRRKEDAQLYDFGGNVLVRTDYPSYKIDVDGKGHRIEVYHALDAWESVLSHNSPETYALYTLSNDRQKLDVLIHGSGPGMESCGVAVKALLDHKKPVWGCFRVNAIHEAGQHTTSIRHKFIGFQVIPDSVPPMARNIVRWVKPLLQRTLHQATLWIDTDDLNDILDEASISKRLTQMAGGDVPTSFDFGGKLDDKQIEHTRLYVTESMNSESIVEEHLRRLEGQQKALEQMEAEGKKRVTFEHSKEQNALCRMLADEMKSESNIAKVEKFERAARKRTVEANVLKEQEEQILDERVRAMKTEQERHDNQEHARQLEDAEKERRDQELAHMPGELPEEQQKKLHDVAEELEKRNVIEETTA